jgi:hypothetical protein
VWTNPSLLTRFFVYGPTRSTEKTYFPLWLGFVSSGCWIWSSLAGKRNQEV